MDGGLPKLNQDQVAMMVCNMIMPLLRKKLKAHPKGFFNWTIRTRHSFTENALEEILYNPANYRLKLVIMKTPYWDGKGFSKLASKLQKYV